jgi:hypothetical protein
MGAGHDRITSFAVCSDKVDLSYLAAVSGMPADDRFPHIGAAANGQPDGAPAAADRRG